jgi:hypothetical protein
MGDGRRADEDHNRRRSRRHGSSGLATPYLLSLPLVIPPVSHKSAVLHDNLKDIWSEAETRLTEATELVVFGYSCPALEFESLNMLRRSGLASKNPRTISLIDPDPATATRYVDLLQPDKLTYYSSADAFLVHHTVN